MSSATMTMIGLYNFAKAYNKDLFEKLTLPEELDRDAAITNILMLCDDKEVLYSDLDFNINMIGMWSTKWARTFQKWVELFNMEYNPIENYDRIENWSDSASTSEISSSSASDSSTGSTSTLNDVSAFNSDVMLNDTSASEQSNNKAQSISRANNDRKDYSEHGGHVHGNIGVTTTQQMMQQEIDIQRFNIYDEIAYIFEREFVLGL